MTALRFLFLHRFDLTGPIPAWLGSLTNLTSLDLSRNQLTGPIPAWLGNLADLSFLYLHANPLTGPLPQRLTQLPLQWFWVHFTQACAPADAAFQEWVGTIQNFRGATCGQGPDGELP